MRSCYFYLPFICFLLAACTSGIRHTVSENRVSCFIGDDTTVVTVCSDNILKIEYSGKNHNKGVRQVPFTRTASGEKAFDVKETGEGLCISAGNIKAVVDDEGNISFFDRKDKLLTKAIRPVAELTQIFTDAGEGIYGWGQFQNGIMNTRGVPLRLSQYNQEIAVPFIISTNGYGMLWENTSVTDVNHTGNELKFNETVDSTANTRRTVFVPAESGEYCFGIESPNRKNRFKGPVLLTFNGDTAIHYNTTWVPDFHSGKIFLEKGKQYEVLFTNTAYAESTPAKVMYNPPSYRDLEIRSRFGNGISYYMMAGSPEKVMKGYREVTGGVPMFSRNVYGFWQCRERYSSQEELLENAEGYRKRRIPIDNIVQDWNYWPKKTWGPEWERSRYPSPEKMCSELKKMNLHLMVSVWPRVKNEKIENRYRLKELEFNENGNIDFFTPEGGKRFHKLLQDSMYSMGVDYIWLDGTEPEVFTAESETSMGKLKDNALAYSYVITRSIYGNKKKDYPDTRVFNLTRSAFAGQQQFGAAVWSGDVLASWEQFREQISAGLNIAMAGIPFWTTDIGGFFRDSKGLNGKNYGDQYTDTRYKELLSRWFQFGTFCPIFRLHGYRSQTEIWRYGPEFEKMATSYIKLRYRLLPYIYSEAAKITLDSTLIMRPLVHDFPREPRCYDIKDQFMFGGHIMVCPVTTEGAKERKVFLPEGKWFDFWNGRQYSGGKTISSASPLERIPLFIKAGTILPVGPEIQYAMQPADGPTKLYIFPGNDGEYRLYEDSGEGYDYEKGEYSLIGFSWNDKTGTLTIGDRKGDFEGMDTKRTFEIILADGQDGVLEYTASKKIEYSGKRLTIVL